MRIAKIALIFAALLCLQACSNDRRGPAQRQAEAFSQGIAGPGAGVRPGPGANAAYIAGLEKRKAGDCKSAIDIVRPVANLGPGYEGAQFALGDCLSRVAPGANTPEHHEALTWLLRAADGGWTEAQGRLAEFYALGPDGARDKAEAAYWLALYQLGAGMPRFGFEPMAPTALSAIETALSASERDAGRARAATWQKKTWIPPKAAQPSSPESGVGAQDGRRMRRGPRGAEEEGG
ncbi:MAG: sel1 repeat family protein [Alphaproteobacteria bacterium]|nr:sel1 repeat family protein [Alphaproteobacteria bacterium]